MERGISPSELAQRIIDDPMAICGAFDDWLHSFAREPQGYPARNEHGPEHEEWLKDIQRAVELAKDASWPAREFFEDLLPDSYSMRTRAR